MHSASAFGGMQLFVFYQLHADARTRASRLWRRIAQIRTRVSVATEIDHLAWLVPRNIKLIERAPSILSYIRRSHREPRSDQRLPRRFMRFLDEMLGGALDSTGADRQLPLFSARSPPFRSVFDSDVPGYVSTGTPGSVPHSTHDPSYTRTRG